MINATRRLLSTMAVICLVASTAMAEDPRTLEKQAAVPAEGLTITRAMAGKVDITKALAAKVRDNRLVIVATSAFLGVDAGNDKIVVEYVLNGKPQTIELSAIANTCKRPSLHSWVRYRGLLSTNRSLA